MTHNHLIFLFWSFLMNFGFRKDEVNDAGGSFFLFLFLVMLLVFFVLHYITLTDRYKSKNRC